MVEVPVFVPVVMPVDVPVAETVPVEVGAAWATAAGTAATRASAMTWKVFMFDPFSLVESFARKSPIVCSDAVATDSAKFSRETSFGGIRFPPVQFFFRKATPMIQGTCK